MRSWKDTVIRTLEDNRGLVILFFVLPCSLIFDWFVKLRKYLDRKLTNFPLLRKSHDEKVKSIQNQVLLWNKQPPSARKPLCTSRPNWMSLSTTFTPKTNFHKIPVNLYNILSVDTENLRVTVEPMVTVEQICEYLIPRGYTLAVTLEIADATCGGLAMGVGMTTHSHKVGLYQETILSYDVVLGDGTLAHVTADNQFSDLFYCLPWSHGSLGLLVALELKIIKVLPYVHIKYRPVNGLTNICQSMRDVSGSKDNLKETPDYLEATVYSKHEAVIMEGNFASVTNKDLHKINHVTKWYKPWFYKHVQSFLNKPVNNEGIAGEEFIPIRDYLLRHNRAIFWVVESMIPFGNNPLFRLLFGWLLPPKPTFLKFTTTPGIRAMTFSRQVFQDIVLPMTVLEESIDLSDRLFDTYPILIYPCRIYDHGPNRRGQLRPPQDDQMCPDSNYGMFYDLGVYGIPGPVRRREKYNPVDAMRAMEAFIRKSNGYSFLYADIFMTEKEFDEMFDLTTYDAVRAKYHAIGAFPKLFDKVKPEVDVFKLGREYALPG